GAGTRVGGVETLRDGGMQLGRGAQRGLDRVRQAEAAGAGQRAVRARGNQLVERARQHAALRGGEAGQVGVRHGDQSKSVARLRFIVSAMCSASAWMVLVGFTAAAVTKMLPSMMNRLRTSWQRPHALTTERSGSVPMRAVPIRCQP